MSREIPILFSAPMIRAILREIEKPGGGKTQTRRILKRARVFATPERPAFTLTGGDMTRALQGADRFRRLDGDGWFWEADAFEWQTPATRTGWMAHFGYAPGDRLWVREAWRVSKSYDAVKPSDLRQRITTTLYEAGGSMGGVTPAPKAGGRPPIEYVPDLEYPTSTPEWAGKGRPSIFMPRWASRLTLIVTGVRVQRLHDISDQDAIAEGVVNTGRRDGAPYDHFCVPGFSEAGMEHDPVPVFGNLWAAINGLDSWEANPWVIAVTFRPILANIDAPEARAA